MPEEITGRNLLKNPWQTIMQAIGVKYIGGLNAPREAEQALAANGAISVDSLDMRVHGQQWRNLVTVCFDLHIGIHIRGDAQAAIDHLAAQMMQHDGMSMQSAKLTVAELFPSGNFIRNKDS